MKQQMQVLYCIVTILLLFNPVPCQTPPHLHKLPLNLTTNYVYYADLYFGTNEEKISVLVDTGSRTLATFCSLCVHGCELDQQFQVENSTTFMNVTCSDIDQIINESLLSPALKVCKSYCRIQGPAATVQCKGELNYGSSSLSSFLDYLLILDLVSVNQAGLRVPSSFGCIYDQRNFDTGIWGLALTPDNEFLDQIYAADQAQGYTNAQKLFTICTAGQSSIMNIGDIDSTYHIGEGFTMRVNPTYNLWWNIIIDDIGAITYKDTVIRSEYQSFGGYGIILDSGTDFSILPAVMVNKIMEIAENICNQVTGCKKIEPYEVFNLVLNLPDPSEYFKNETITFTIGGRQLQTPLSNYFWNLGDGSWALAVVSSERFNFQMSILGSIWMNNFDIVFDRQHLKITIYDITGCQAPSRRLQTEDDDYILPSVRCDRMDGTDAINKIKMKHQRGIIKMFNEGQGL